MQFALDILKKIIAYLPQVFNWWLYSSERTKKNIDVTIHNKDGSVEFCCDEQNPYFRISIEFKNNNPFPIEIDRIRIHGWMPGALKNGAISEIALIKAFELMGGRIDKNQKRDFCFRDNLDDVNLKIVNEAPYDTILNLHIKAVIINKYYYIRDFTTDLNRLMCKFVNKNVQK